MSSRTSSSKPLGKAGIIIIILRIIGMSVVLLPTFYVLFSTSPDIMIYAILQQLAPFIGFVTTLVLMISILIAFIRMDSPSTLGIIFGIILLVLEILYFAAYFTMFTLFDFLGVITLTPIFIDILLYSLVIIPGLLGICYIIVFVVLAKNLRKYSNMRDMKIIIIFTMLYGIFMGLFYIFTGLSSTIFIISGIPPDWLLYILLASTYLVVVVGGIAGICLIVIATGYIILSKRD
ncbi:MAG: hypothetical protein ACTSRE_01680 [Promethearchaeota archaeon]